MKKLLVPVLFLFVYQLLELPGSLLGAVRQDWKYLPWVHELKYSPKYMGPNALPVPETVFGKLDGNMEIESRAVSNSSVGDRTDNVYLRLAYPVVKNVVSLEMTDIFEHYNLSSNTIIPHKNAESLGEGYMAGDINVATIIQAVRNKTFPDVIIRVNLRSASGKNRQAARFTDAPGYFFDASFSKGLNFENKIINQAGLYASAGFYCWQTNDDFHAQDDAKLGSCGAFVYSGKLRLKSELAGYFGYMDNGDRPLVSRTSLVYKSSHTSYTLQYQTGIHDFEYKTFSFGFSFFFDAPSLPVYSDNKE
jgi:hypothetical protein